MVFPEPTPDMFNFNSPVGACSTCEGYGHVLGIDPDKVIPDPTKSLYDGAVAPWRGERTGRWRDRMIMSVKLAFPCTLHGTSSLKLSETWFGMGVLIFEAFTPFSPNLKKKATRFKTGS